MQKVYAIIPAGGSGKRIGGEIPKQFIRVGEKEIIAHTLEVFQNCELVDEIIVASIQNFFDLLQEIKSKYNFDKITKIVEGGNERQDSVFNALSSISPNQKDLVAVHDAARPLIPQSVLVNAIDKAKESNNAVVAIKAKDTLVKGFGNIVEYIDRNDVYYVQTPQVFRYGDLMQAMKKAREEKFLGTDESTLIKRSGTEVFLTEGSSLNFKITTQFDLELFKKIIGDKL